MTFLLLLAIFKWNRQDEVERIRKKGTRLHVGENRNRKNPVWCAGSFGSWPSLALKLLVSLVWTQLYSRDSAFNTHYSLFLLCLKGGFFFSKSSKKEIIYILLKLDIFFVSLKRCLLNRNVFSWWVTFIIVKFGYEIQPLPWPTRKDEKMIQLHWLIFFFSFFFLWNEKKKKTKKLEIEVTLPPSLLQIHDREKWRENAIHQITSKNSLTLFF